eukprot:TRINITY_DN3288_c0_g1_i1.p1 TRINITY_DN3288_c0_g1~~TRINITY_DN3288_c0_g1_i1.p1  ORF type:complete len:408 (+),score=77.44 TRINITY_DN3288_c0_g1_i1:165-1388(+)
MSRISFFLQFATLLILGGRIMSQIEGSAAVNQFTQSLLPLLCKAGQNCAISGYSIFNALGLTYAGSLGDTQSQIQQVLNLNGVQKQEVDQIFSDLINSVSGVSREVELLQANRFYGANEFPFLKSYLDALEKFYKADAVNLDFVSDPEGSRQQINDWVEEVTKNLIQDLLPPDSIGSGTISVLINALYFKGTWIEEFDKSRTAPREFTTSSGSVVNVPTMVQSEQEYVVGDVPSVQASFIRLPYKGEDVSMYIVVPKSLSGRSSNQSINDILQKISLNDLFSEKSSTTVNLQLPKFTVESSARLSDALKQLGMVDAFSPSVANLGGMVDLEKFSGNLFVSEGFHKAKVVVDETGTEAAAATAIAIVLTSMPIGVVDFVVDESFGYFIVKEPENVVLFSGIVDNPSSA